MLELNCISRVCKAPMANVEASWPLVVSALYSDGIWNKDVAIAAAATIAVETGVYADGDGDGDKEILTFLPIRELGSAKRLNWMYDRRTDLGNTPELDGDGALWCGRGLIQLTGKKNYILYGEELGIDLVGNPDLALDPKHAADIFARYFLKSRAAEAAMGGDWFRVRRRVNGGDNGMEPFLAFVSGLHGCWKDAA